MTKTNPDQPRGPIACRPIARAVLRFLAAGNPRCTKIHTGCASAANVSRDGASIALVAASNEMQAPTSASDACLFVPFGSYPVKVRDKMSGRMVDALQRFDEDAAGAVIAGLRGVRGAVSRLFGRAPVYVGHPDVPEFAARHTDTRAYGRVTGANIAERDGKRGIEFGVAWNRLGVELMDSGAYMYHSPHWPLAIVGRKNGVLMTRPVGLRSIGLTNEPNIADAVIFGANVEFVDDPTQAANEPAGQHQAVEEPLLPRLISVIGDSSLADDNAVVRYVSALLDELRIIRASIDAHVAPDGVGAAAVANDKTSAVKLSELLADREAKLADAIDAHAASSAAMSAANDLNDKLTADIGAFTAANSQRDSAITALVTLAVESGRLPGGKAKDTIAAFSADFDAALASVANAKPMIPLGSATVDLGLRKRNGGAGAEFLTAVNEVMAQRGCSFTAAWVAVKAARPELYGLL